MKAERTNPGRGAPLNPAGRLIQRQAAEWLARCQSRPLTLTEQADLADWLAQDSRHAALLTEVEASWNALDSLAAYPHPADLPPDPDLLAPPRREANFARSFVPAGQAAAAAVVIGGLWWLEPTAGPASSPPVAKVVPMESRLLSLPDGSAAELNAETQVVEVFTAQERRVRLVRGEAHFTVTPDPSRPFFVEANGVAVRAVGTAFNVRLMETGVEVLVTEGTVQVGPPASRVPPSSRVVVAGPPSGKNDAVLTMGQRAVVFTAPEAAVVPPAIETLTPVDIDRVLAWQTSRFTFESAPLAQVVARFNRNTSAGNGAVRLTVSDAGLGALRISGRIRSDNIESFVEVLEASFGVVAERRPDGEILLRPAGR